MWTSALFGEKTSFFKIFGVSAWTIGEKGSNFRDFVRTSFMDGLLIFIMFNIYKCFVLSISTKKSVVVGRKKLGQYF